MKVLFLEHDHVSPREPLAQRFREIGFDTTEVVVVPLLAARSNSTTTASLPPRMRPCSPTTQQPTRHFDFVRISRFNFTPK
mgnify:CR=1 FL=1|jgi:hypothetical protein